MLGTVIWATNILKEIVSGITPCVRSEQEGRILMFMSSFGPLTKAVVFKASGVEFREFSSYALGHRPKRERGFGSRCFCCLFFFFLLLQSFPCCKCQIFPVWLLYRHADVTHEALRCCSERSFGFPCLGRPSRHHGHS